MDDDRAEEEGPEGPFCCCCCVEVGGLEGSEARSRGVQLEDLVASSSWVMLDERSPVYWVDFERS